MTRVPSLALLALALALVTSASPRSQQGGKSRPSTAPIGPMAPFALTSDLGVPSMDASGVVGDWQTLAIGGSVDVDVANVGGSAVGPFDVVLFEDAAGEGSLDGADLVLGSTTVGLLTGDTTTTLTIPVSGTVRFRQNLIHAVVDAGGDVAETDETNNVAHTGLACLVSPIPGTIDPVVEWAWTSSPVQPTALNVMMTPSVIDLDDDGIPEVVFGSTASNGGGLIEVGFLRALRGADGSELFTVQSPQISTTFTVATGDIDGDGRPEIVAGSATNNTLLAFEHDGSLKWTSAALAANNWGAATLADLDMDGTPEIVVGRQVLNADGTIRWVGTGGSASQGNVGSISVVADVDLDGMPEVVAGNTLYEADGTIQWQMPLGDGHNAVANMDGDPEAEIVLVTGGQVYLLEHTGVVKWGPRPIPGGGIGGPPTIANYDADPEREVGVAGATRYVVLDNDGTQLWSAVTQDSSSNRTGSSVFDFDGDGAAEVVYRDELMLRIYRGSDGMVLFNVPMSSCTWHEYVHVADVDGDGNAEIVAVANTNCGFGPQKGVSVFGSASDSWVPTREIWNQHAYHITSVNDDGTIPASEAENWLTPAGNPFNNYRQNVLNGLDPRTAPDLTASLLLATSDTVTGRIGNGGGILAPAGVPVSFYDGDPGSGGILLGTTSTSVPLGPGAFEDVSLFLGVPPPAQLFVSADDMGGGLGQQSECDETNNVHGRIFQPPTFGPVCGTTVNGTVGSPVSFVVSASDPDGDPLVLTASGVPSGAVHVPALPVLGSPVASTFSWTPAAGQEGTHVIDYLVDDGLDTVACQVTVEVVAVACVTLDFETEDDFTTPLGNGQGITTPPEFGNLVAISGTGPNAGAAIFDSTPGGPNDPSQDTDLLVARGNVLILQNSQVPTQTSPDVFDRPNDDQDGGDLLFSFLAPVEAQSLVLIDIDAGNNQASQVQLTDAAGRVRTYSLPPRWTEDRLIDGGTGWRTLDVTTLAPQPGFASTATASEQAGFDARSVVLLRVHLGSSGAVDDVVFCP